MQIVKLELSHYNLFCPATGERILYPEHCNDDAKSLKAYWCDLFFEEPFIKDEELKTKWNAFVKSFKETNGYDPDFAAYEKFLKEYDKPNWIVFKISDSGNTCAPTSSTAWHIIDMDTILVEDMDTDDEE